MSFYADFHVHSKYSRATAKNLDLENLSIWGKKKGISVIGTGDFTHPGWMKELEKKLVPAGAGLFKLRKDIEKQVSQASPKACTGRIRFVLSVEISTIYKKGERTRRVHHVVVAPSFKKAQTIRKKLQKIGNLHSDGRPILGLDSRNLLEVVLEAGEDCFLIPAHIWTPWFSVLGSESGFGSIKECYGDLEPYIFAVETGLSSDPEMNWRVSSLDRYSLVSHSDAHSPSKLGREACRFDTELDYYAMRQALMTGKRYAGTIEFFPEQGKYHLDGHRKCGIRLSPEESRLHKGVCPVCHKSLTLGVLYRVEELADRKAKKPKKGKDYTSLIPVPEILSEIVGVGPQTKKVATVYEKLLHDLGSELSILCELPLEKIKRSVSSSLFTEAIRRMRKGKVIREAGYDGEYGRIKLFTKKELGVNRLGCKGSRT